MMPQKDGIYENIPDREYRSWDLPSATAVKILAMGGTPAHYHGYIHKPDSPSPAQKFGSMVHRAILEPEWFDTIRPLPPEVPKRTGEKYKTLLEENQGISFLPPGEWAEFSGYKESALIIQERVKSHPIAWELVERAKKEVSFVWTD